MPVTAQTLQRLSLLLTVAVCGCASPLTSRDASVSGGAVPARRVPPSLLARSKEGLVPLDFTLLRQVRPDAYRVGRGDVLGIYIENVLGQEDLPPPVTYPVVGETNLRTPAVGHPIEVREDGTISLPLVDPIHVSGKTFAELVAAIREIYIGKQILREGRDRISADLIRPRATEVFVLREDASGAAPAILHRDTTIIAQRGSAHALELPAYNNDVMHALTETGGLPGTDAYNQIWVLRGNSMSATTRQHVMGQLEAGGEPEEVLATHGPGTRFIRIPLRVCPGQALPFGRSDVILEDGDVVFVETRDTEFFITGGLLDGGQYALPRDYDLDIFGALAIAGGNATGPTASSAARTSFRTIGNIVPPTRVIIVRRLENGDQFKIEVDLRIAVNDSRERIIIQPGDLVLLKYRPAELAANVALNAVNVGYVIPN